MNFIKPLVAVLLLINGPVILESCCDEVCGTCSRTYEPVYPPKYDVEGMSMKLLDRANYKELTSSTAALSHISFMAEIQPNFTSLLSTSKGFAAYACAPPNPLANQKILSIAITSNNDITTNVSTILKGEDLSSIFFVVLESYYGPFDDWIFSQPLHGVNLEFISEARVTSPQTHIFTFRISLDNGDTFEMTTEALTLTTY